MSSLLERFTRTRKGLLCPVCEHSGWCMVELGPDSEPVAAICPRTPSPVEWGRAGYFHDLAPGRARQHRRPRTISLEPLRRHDELAAELHASLDARTLSRVASDLGLAELSLCRLGMGVARGVALRRLGRRRCSEALTFPMTDHRARVIGIRIRLQGGTKLCLKGSAAGLFVPSRLDVSGTVFIAEGETDTAALLTMGVEAFGRPGAQSCQTLCAKFARVAGLKDVVLVADADAVGRAGAERLAVALRMIVPRVRLVTPPAKDVRVWLHEGATRAELEALCVTPMPMRAGGLS